MAPNVEILYIPNMAFQRIYLLLVLAVSCSFLYACGCVSSDNCAEEIYEDVQKANEVCKDQKKYDDCMSEYKFAQYSSDFDVKKHCFDVASYLCNEKSK
jgi:hypothetical protein